MTDVTVIIDVQEGFSGRRFVTRQCRKLAERAVEEGHKIVLVEFSGRNETCSNIWDVVRPAKPFIVRKDRMSGGDNIHHLLSQVGVDPERFHIGGIYLNECVWATTQSLMKHYPSANMILYEEAISGNDESELPSKYRWEGMDVEWVPKGHARSLYLSSDPEYNQGV